MISADADHRVGNDDHTQGNLYRLMRAEERGRVVALKAVPSFIQMRQIGHFCRADPEYGSRVAEGLGLDIGNLIGKVA